MRFLLGMFGIWLVVSLGLAVLITMAEGRPFARELRTSMVVVAVFLVVGLLGAAVLTFALGGA